MEASAGIRKTGPWATVPSGIIATPTLSQFYLDRQANLSIVHERTGLIITGANSKRQPELATFSEEIDGRTYHLPMSSQLDMKPEQDRLALAYNKFFTVLRMAPPNENSLEFSALRENVVEPPFSGDFSPGVFRDRPLSGGANSCSTSILAGRSASFPDPRIRAFAPWAAAAQSAGGGAATDRSRDSSGVPRTATRRP